MEAMPVSENGSGWLFEPKYAGFRCPVRDGDEVHLHLLMAT